MGGWSIGFRRQGFDCEGVDIEDWGYPYKLTLADCRQYQATPNHWDIVVASPPCKEFSKLRFLNPKKPGDPQKGMILVKEAKRIIDEANPRIWLIENVEGSLEHIVPFLGPPKLSKRPYFLWGNFPSFLMSQTNLPRKTNGGPSDHPNLRLNADARWNPWASALRARIPIPLSMSVAKACAEFLSA